MIDEDRTIGEHTDKTVAGGRQAHQEWDLRFRET